MGKIVRIDAPALISFSKNIKLKSPEQDTSFQTIIENGRSTNTIDTVIQRRIKLDDFFTCPPKTFDMANNIKINMENDHIIFEYRNKIEHVTYENLFKEQVEAVFESLGE